MTRFAILVTMLNKLSLSVFVMTLCVCHASVITLDDTDLPPGARRQGRIWNFGQQADDGSGSSIGFLQWFNEANWFSRSAVPEVQCSATNGALDMGTCFTEGECESLGGVTSGLCATGGACCVFPTVCGGTITRNRTWFVNKDFPDYSTDSGDCELIIRRPNDSVRQVRLDFRVNELSDALQGKCLRDEMTLHRAIGNKNLMPSLCGNNNGQHVYMDFAYQDLKLQIKLRGERRRKWYILVTYVRPSTEVSPGCLQFYADRSATIRSLNYNSGSYLFTQNMDYDICFPPANRQSENGERCERKTKDIDLRQSENDIRTKKQNTPVKEDEQHEKSLESNAPVQLQIHRPRFRPIKKFTRMGKQVNVGNVQHSNVAPVTFIGNRYKKYDPDALSKAYSLATEPGFPSQFDRVKSQLTNSGNSGLTSLLNSKSKLEQMNEQVGKSDDDDVYYYYYYEDDFLKNEINKGGVRAPVTDNYAVEHMKKEFVVLPDGSPVPASFFTKKPTTTATPQTQKAVYYPFRTQLPTSNSQQYFHTGMIQEIYDNSQKTSNKIDAHYPIPTFYTRPTTTPSSDAQEKVSTYPGAASIYVFDPVPQVVPQNEMDTSQSIPLDIASITTSPNIDSKNEYLLKHDGDKWLFLLNEEETETEATPISTEEEEQESSTEVVVAKQPHIVFKHPSGKVTEMIVEDSDSGEPDEKIVTVIETGEFTQNVTKFRIDNIAELDRVVEAVFEVLEETNNDSENTKFVPDNEDTKPKPALLETKFTKSPEPTFGTMTTNSNPYFENKYVTIRSPIEGVNMDKTAQHIIKTMPSSVLEYLDEPKSSILPENEETFAEDSEPEADILPVVGANLHVDTKLDTTPVESVDAETSDIYENEREDMTVIFEEENSSPTKITFSPGSSTAEKLFTTMLDSLKQTSASGNGQSSTDSDSSNSPLFKISTKKNGIMTTKKYSTIAEAINDLQTISEKNGGVTKPMNFNQEMSTNDPAPSESTKSFTSDLAQFVTNPVETTFDFGLCDESYIGVDGMRVCKNLIRSDDVRKQVTKLFDNMERISVRSLQDSENPLRFSLTFETVCEPQFQILAKTTPINRIGSAQPQQTQIKTVSLIEYLLGWY